VLNVLADLLDGAVHDSAVLRDFPGFWPAKVMACICSYRCAQLVQGLLMTYRSRWTAISVW